MCYLRNFAPIQKHTIFKQDLDTNSFIESQQNILSPARFQDPKRTLKENKILQTQICNPDYLSNLIKMLQTNNKVIQSIESVCQFLNQKLDQNLSLMEYMKENDKAPEKITAGSQVQEQTEDSSEADRSSSRSQEQLAKILFGDNKQYKFKINLDEGLPDQIFKERNFSFKVKLTDLKGNKIRNSNIIHVCLGICDANGAWITETKSKEPLIKGKTESELYHGEGAFSKIFSRDVSRSYPKGKLNIVVYPKESALRYSLGSNLVEEEVMFSSIEPLIIRDLTIKAKKKQ